MLTVSHGPVIAKRQIVFYTCLLSILSLFIAFSEIGGPIFLAVSTILNLIFLGSSIKLLSRNSETSLFDGFRLEKRLFLFSIYYLFLVFIAIGVEAVLRSFGVGFPNWPTVI